MRFAAALLLCAAASAQVRLYPNRWVLMDADLTTDAGLEQIRQTARIAAAHGLTGMVVRGFDLITRWSPESIERVRKAKAICAAANLEIVPMMFGVGWAGVVVHDRNLAEGLPVRDALFVARGGTARLEPDPPVAFRGNWFYDEPGTVSFTEGAAVRMHVANAPRGLARAIHEVTVAKHRAYRVSFRLKTEGLQPAGAFYFKVLGAGDRDLAPGVEPPAPAQPWKRVVWGFNSGDNEKVRVYAGTWGARSGTVWLDDFRIEEVGPLNVLRRPGAPVTVRGEGGNIVYREGADYAEITDGNLFRLLYDHDPPPIRLLPGGRIREGERLRVSYYQGVEVGGSQVSACMSEPKLYEIFAAQARRVHELLAPKTYFLGMDEIRVAASCDACRRRGIGAARILGDSISRIMALVRRINPQAEFYIWSDMLDPNHNAHNNYYLVEGDLTGSWNYVPKDLGVVCWYRSKRVESLRHFSSLGMKVMAGTYYDGPDLSNVSDWWQALSATPRAQGLIYCTFEHKYDLLGAFGDLVTRPVP